MCHLPTHGKAIPMSLYPLLLLVHLAGVVIWVGGMLFAYQFLRPPAAQLLEPPTRLRLWRQVLGRFFVWVWLAIVLIPASGFAILLPVGFAAAPLRWHLMMGLGLAMIAIFLHVYFAPYASLRRAVDAEDWQAGAAALGRIRRMVGVNILLGALVITIATLGRLFDR